jgi:hypothetical protein
MTIPFVSTADLSEFLGQDVTSDQLAVIALDSACEIIRAYVGQRLNFDAVDVVTLNGNGRSSIILPQLPVVDIAEVVADDTVLAADSYYATRSGVLSRMTLYDVWPVGIQNIEVTYSHGFAVLEADVEDDPDDDTPKPDRMPSDIRRVALALARRVFVASGSVAEAGTKASETITPDSYSYTNATTSASGTTTVTTSSATELTLDERAILDLHRFARVA